MEQTTQSLTPEQTILFTAIMYLVLIAIVLVIDKFFLRGIDENSQEYQEAEFDYEEEKRKLREQNEAALESIMYLKNYQKSH